MTLALISGAVVSAVLQAVVRSVLLRLQWVDHPNFRSSHTTPIPRGGGIAVFIAVLVALLITPTTNTAWLLFAWSSAFALLGFVDDRRGLPAMARLLCQLILAAGAVLTLGSQVRLAVEPGLLLAWILAVVWSVGYTNAFNFMDGINGISALNTVVAGLVLGVVGAAHGLGGTAVFAVSLAGASLGFLPWNAPSARLFLGDVGSYGLGSGLALTAVWLAFSGVSLLLCIAPFTLYVFDTGYTLVRRILSGESWMQAHREHVYQRLVHSGFSHVSVSLGVSAISLIVALVSTAIVASRLPHALAYAAMAIAGAVYVSSPYWLRQRRFGRG